MLDLRNNPGGLLTQAVKISDVFLDSGLIVYTDGRLENQKQKYFAHKANTWDDFPMVVLVNGGSAQRLGDRRGRAAGPQARARPRHRRPSARARCRPSCRSTRTRRSASRRRATTRRTAAPSRRRASSPTSTIEQGEAGRRRPAMRPDTLLREANLPRHLEHPGDKDDEPDADEESTDADATATMRAAGRQGRRAGPRPAARPRVELLKSGQVQKTTVAQRDRVSG